MNIIFLDIDGVLNSCFWEKEHREEISNGTLIDLKKVELLSRLINEFSAKIVRGLIFWRIGIYEQNRKCIKYADNNR
jgi:hypothetical protein